MEINKNLLEKLDTIISLMIPRFDVSHYDLKGLPLEVLKLCDYDNTVQDMIKKLKKGRGQIDNSLSKLRAKGLIKSINKNDTTVYVRLK